MIDISVTDLVKSFDLEKKILDGVSFQIDTGERVGLLGKNGAGKSTLFNILTGELDYDSGQVLIAPGRRVGLISQIPVYPEGYTVEDVLRSAFQRTTALKEEMDRLTRQMEQGDSDPQTLRRYGELTARFEGLGGYDTDTAVNKVSNGLSIDGDMRQRLFDQLSGGEKTRVNLGRLILEDTDILLLDEPLSALDRKVRAEMQYEIRNLQRQIGTTTVFVTHDQEEALTMSDQIILLHDGQIEQQGDPFTIYSQPASVFASDFLGKANLLSGVLACEDGVWCVCSENVRIPVNHVGGREGDTVKTAVRGEYFEFCTPETEGANPFHLEKKIFTGLSWKLIGTLGTQPLDISALGTHAGTLSEGDDLFVRIRPENVVYYNNN